MFTSEYEFSDSYVILYICISFKQFNLVLQDFNSECSDISQLDLKLEYAQDQLRIQNHHLFNQYLHQLLANNQLSDIINQFEGSFIEKADTNEGLTTKEEVDVDVSNIDTDKIREQLKTLNDLVEKTRTQLEDHKGK